MKLEEKNSERSAIRLLYDNIIDFKGAAEHVESEIRRLGILYDSWEEMPGTEGRIHHEMWVSYKTVSHFNIGTALELMLKLILHLQSIPWSDIPKGQRHSLTRLYDKMPAQHKDWLEIKYRATKRGLPEGLAFLGFVNRSPDAPGPEYSAPSREVYRLRGLLEYLDENAKLWKTRYSWESMLENNWRYYLNDVSVLSELIDRVLSEIPRDNPVLKLESATKVPRK